MRKRTGFFKISHDFVDSGGLADIPDNMLKVYLSILNHKNYTTGKSRPSISTISKETGLQKRAIYYALKWLENYRLIARVESGGGRGKANVYQL